MPPQGEAHPGAPQSRYNAHPYPMEDDGHRRVRDDKSAAAERARLRREEEEMRLVGFPWTSFADTIRSGGRVGAN